MVKHMKSLYYSFDTTVDNAYIITLKNNSVSEKYSARCQASCTQVGMNYIIWDAFDGTSNVDIKVPTHLQDETFFEILKLSHTKISFSQIATLLSHVSLWYECAKIDKPIVILEHDTILLKRFDQMNHYNAIVYLGCAEWVKEGWPVYPIPPFGSEGENYRFLLRNHAYAIDPPMAKNLLAHVLQFGLHNTVDFLSRTDIFHVTHQGVYAYDERGQTTITGLDRLNK